MNVDGQAGEIWDDPERDETQTQRLDRNWANLLQELRVVQTGVQLLTGLLLTLPFHDGFEDLRPQLRMVYLATVACSVVSTVLLASPVATHRLLFRRRRLAQVVATAHRMTFWGLMLLGVSLVGVVVLVFGTVAGDVAGVAAGAVALVGFLVFWVVVPLRMRDTPPPRAS
ncbi:MAG: sodium:proton antiporter [Mycobacterium sp.]|nr:sodium:proton antiporter [Mycobacterium sp.]